VHPRVALFVQETVRQSRGETMFRRASAQDTWLEVSYWSSDDEHGLARRKAVFHRRHFRARAHEWGVAVLLVVVSLVLAGLEALAVLH
jgi:hypothetical protein